MANDRDFTRDLEHVLDGIAESILTESDEAILEELRATGADPAAEAARLKGVLLAAVRKHEQRLLLEARERVRLRLLQSPRWVPPADLAARRALFGAVLTRQPDLSGMLTVHGRELSSLTDEDIATCLDDLAALGVLGGRTSDEE